ncbi:MAG: ATP-binding protein [Bacteroidota bacterium]
MRLKSLARTLAFRLFIFIASVQTIILVGLTFAVLHVQQTSWMRHIVGDAIRISDVIVRSTRYSMLLNRKQDVHRIVGSVSGESGITGIRIYNKQGEAIFGPLDSGSVKKVDIDGEACVVCHVSGGLESAPTVREEMHRIFRGSEGERVLGLITPIHNEPECANVACHVDPKEKTILGVLDVKMSLAQMDAQLEETRNSFLTLSLAAVVLVGIVAGAFLWIFVLDPVQRVTKGMELIAAGNLNHRLDVSGKDELAQLAGSFDVMASDLQTARQEITDWSKTLEKKVREKTADLEVAHKQIMQAEKMSSIGNLASSVAHELNNPLEGILTYAKLIRKRLVKLNLPSDTQRTYEQELALIADEAQRCGNIVKNLLVFARAEEMAVKPVRLYEIINRCEMLVRHHAEINGVTVETKCTDLDSIECDADQIQQVLLALMVNAIEAMAPKDDKLKGGLLSLVVVRNAGDDTLEIRVADNGVGMAEEVKTHLFEPFFTTKTEARGVGLGLAVSYGIVQRHHGTIEVESSVGHGTVFTISLPVRQRIPVSDPS